MTKSTLGGLAGKLMFGTALVTLAASAASAQNEIVTVTGTSIRGQAPVGANVITVDRAEITAQGAQTAQQLLANVPQLAGFGNAAQGSIGSFDGAGTQAPTIHSLGASASNTTLVLINGHRIPLSGLNHTLADPSIIPAAAIQRVEVLPDGASSVYGSDAMAGVLNFITRRDYDGWESSAQYGFADGYNTANVSQLFGHSWDGGSVLAVYNYSNRSRLNNVDRDFITARQDLRHGTPTTNPNTGGANFNDFSCSPATIAANSTATTVFAGPTYTGSGISTTTAAQAGICNRVDAISVLPGEVRNSGLASIRQSLSERLTVTADLVYSSRLGTARQARGTLAATAYSPNAVAGAAGVPSTFVVGQRNPFFVAGATGITSFNNSQFVRYDFEELLGHGAYQKTGANDAMATLGLDYDVGGGWAASLGSTIGANTAFQRNVGVVNQAEALLALNGTVNSGGNVTTNALADPYGLGTTVTVTRALNAGNALDVWNPVATNRTSETVRRSLTDSATNLTTDQFLQDAVLKLDGPLFDLPAGAVKAAFGGEYIHHTMNQRNTTLNSTGPSSTSARFLSLASNRTIYAAFAEFVVPVVSADMGIPLIQKLDITVAGRYDHYSDVGDTKNPKIGFTWNIVDGLIARGTFGTSFTAPALTSSGQPGTGITGETSVTAGGVDNNAVIPYNWVGVAGTWVQDAATCNANGGTGTAAGCQINTTTTPGITINGGNANIKPETGTSYSAGFDVDAGAFWDVLNGLTVNVTYWQAKYLGLITAPAFTLTVPFASLQPRSVFAPPGGWAPNDPALLALIGNRPLTAALPARVWHVYDFTQGNIVNLQANGIDWGIGYEVTSDTLGRFTFRNDGGMKLRFDQNNGPSTAPWTRFLNGRNRSTTFNSIAWTMRSSIGWSLDAVSAQFSWNFVNAYHNNNSNPPYNVAAPDGSRTAGREHVSALNTFDLNVGYDIPEDLWSGTRLNLTVTNMFDTPPPYATGGVGGFPGFNGFDGGNAANGNPIGRVVTVGLTKKW